MNDTTTDRERHDDTLFAIAVTAVYAGLILFTTLHHEPWRDEAQAWLIARDASLPAFLKQMSYEGSPALWHLIQRPFARAGLPYVWHSILNVLIATAAIAVFTRRAPFSRATKILFVFSYYTAFEYAVVARSYSLGLLLLFLIADMHPRRLDRPIRYGLLVLLLCNVNVFCLCIASALAVRFAYELLRARRTGGVGKRACAGLGLMGLGLSLAVLQLMPAPDSVKHEMFRLFAPMNVPRAIRSAFFPSPGDKKTYELVAAVILIVVLLSILRRPGALFIVFWSFAALLYIFVFKHSGARRHHAWLFVVLVLGLWLARHEPDVYWFGFRSHVEKLYARFDVASLARVMIRFCLFISVAFCLKMHYEDIRYPFSASQQVARFLLEHDLEHRPIVAHNSYCTAGVLPHLPPRTFWYAGIRRPGSYVVWTEEFAGNVNLSTAEIVERGRSAFPNSNDLLFLLTRRVESPERQGLELLFEPDTSRWLTRDRCAVYRLARPKTTCATARGTADADGGITTPTP